MEQEHRIASQGHASFCTQVLSRRRVTSVLVIAASNVASGQRAIRESFARLILPQRHKPPSATFSSASAVVSYETIDLRNSEEYRELATRRAAIHLLPRDKCNILSPVALEIAEWPRTTYGSNRRRVIAGAVFSLSCNVVATIAPRLERRGFSGRFSSLHEIESEIIGSASILMEIRRFALREPGVILLEGHGAWSVLR